MTNKEALKILKRHQYWRKGAEIKMEDIKELSKAIDKAIEALSDVADIEKYNNNLIKYNRQ